jgi:hypothetical protein
MSNVEYICKDFCQFPREYHLQTDEHCTSTVQLMNRIESDCRLLSYRAHGIEKRQVDGPSGKLRIFTGRTMIPAQVMEVRLLYILSMTQYQSKLIGVGTILVVYRAN